MCAGQAGSEEELAGRYRGLAVGLAMGRFGLRPEDAEDVFQDLLVLLWQDDFKALRAWRGQGKLSTYLTVIVARMCLARRRDAQREAPPLEEPGRPSNDALPDALAARSERAAAAREALSSLSPRDRLLLALRFADEREPKEIAPLFDMSAATCRKAIHDALGRLRRAMRRRRPELFDQARPA